MKAILNLAPLVPGRSITISSPKKPDSGDYLTGPGEGAGPFPGTDEGIHFVDYMVESIVSLTHEALDNGRWWLKLWRKGCVTHRRRHA